MTKDLSSRFIDGVARIIFQLLIILILPLSVFAVEVEVSVTGLRNDNGFVIVGVYPDAKTFAKPKSAPYYNNRVVISHGKASTIFDLPEGTYAISLFHDENANEKLDLNLFGIPKEGWGFSRDAKPSPTWPNFEDAAFKVDSKPVHLTITVNYGLL